VRLTASSSVSRGRISLLEAAIHRLRNLGGSSSRCWIRDPVPEPADSSPIQPVCQAIPTGVFSGFPSSSRVPAEVRGKRENWADVGLRQAISLSASTSVVAYSTEHLQEGKIRRSTCSRSGLSGHAPATEVHVREATDGETCAAVEVFRWNHGPGPVISHFQPCSARFRSTGPAGGRVGESDQGMIDTVTARHEPARSLDRLVRVKSEGPGALGGGDLPFWILVAVLGCSPPSRELIDPDHLD